MLIPKGAAKLVYYLLAGLLYCQSVEKDEVSSFADFSFNFYITGVK